MKRSHSDGDLETARKRNKTLRESLTDLSDIASCPVCFGHLPSDMLSCVNGHVVCVACGNKIKLNGNKCPTCKDSFLPFKPVLLSKILEGLPRICKHDGCDFVTKDVKEITEHENMCEERETKCRIDECSWDGRVKRLLEHVEKCHPKHLLRPFSRRFIKNFADFESYTAVHLVDGVFFWRTTRVSISRGKVDVKVACVPTKENKDTYQLKVKLVSDDCTFTGKRILKLFSDEESKDNVLTIDYEVFRAFVDRSDGSLSYDIEVAKV